MNVFFMMKIAFFSTAACLLVGCYGHTVTGQGIKSPFDNLELVVVAHGATGKAYTERSQKEVYVSVVVRNTEPPVYLFRTKYTMMAGDVQWKARWMSPDLVRLEFEEEPDDRLKSSTPTPGPMPRKLSVHEFARVSATQFREVAVN